MSALKHISENLGALSTIRRDLHENPELGFEVHRTADVVAKQLKRMGLEVHRGIGRTGIVAKLSKGNSCRTIGLRADMDALPIQEEGDLPYRSKVSQCMHACGHDGHTTILLAAADYLTKSGNFDGTVHFIFQPAEEIFGGAKAMLEDGLFERFPCDAVFGLHNRPGLPVGNFSIRSGPMYSGGASFQIAIFGRGSHGARPEDSIDPVLVASHLTLALQSIVARNVAPADAAVVSVTQLTGSDAFNVIPQSAKLGGTARAYRSDVLAKIESRMKSLTTSIAAAFGATASVDFQVLVPPLVNDQAAVSDMVETANELVGSENVITNGPTYMASDDFSFMLEKCGGAYINLGIMRGNQGAALLHTPQYDFNDEAIPYGAALLARVVERRLSAAQ